MDQKIFSKYENANAILNGMDDCADEFVQGFVDLHKEPIDNVYMYEWLLRSLVDILKKDHSVLHIACGTGGYTRLFKNVKRFVGVDFSKKMISAAQKLHKGDSISCSFYCSTFEEFSSEEKFDIIYLGPYGHNVPYRPDVLEKAKSYLNQDGMIVCTITDQCLESLYSKVKELIKNILVNKKFEYNNVHSLEKMLEGAKLETYVKVFMKTSIGYAHCYVVKDPLNHA